MEGAISSDKPKFPVLYSRLPIIRFTESSLNKNVIFIGIQRLEPSLSLQRVSTTLHSLASMLNFRKLRQALS